MEWVEWNGGECPVDGEVDVDVKFRDGDMCDAMANEWRWSHDGHDLDIIAYRLHEPANITTDCQQSTGIGYDLDCEFCKENPEHPDCQEQELDDCIGAPEASKYMREIKPGVWVDVYDVLAAWGVTNPALQHLIKKALQPGQRGHKDRMQDLNDILASAKRAIELERQQ